jgi:peptide/nickel transport system permease protein
MAVAVPVSGVRVESPTRRVVREFMSSRTAVGGAVLLLVIVLLALFAPWIAPQNPYDLSKIDILDGRLPPGSVSPDGLRFLLGTDDQGRDMYSAILYGLRISLGVGVVSALVASAIGASVGLVAAYAGRKTESIIMRIVDLQLSFPSILVALMILAFLGKGVLNVVLALIIVEWAATRAPRAARRWSSGARNTSRPPSAWRSRPGASCSAICCPTSCRR